VVNLLPLRKLPILKLMKSKSTPVLPPICYFIAIWFNFLKSIKKFSICLRKYIGAIFFPSSDQRLMNLIKQISRIYGTKNTDFPKFMEIPLIFTSQELADLIVCKIALVEMMMKKFENKGLIKYSGKYILVRRISMRDICH